MIDASPALILGVIGLGVWDQTRGGRRWERAGQRLHEALAQQPAPRPAPRPIARPVIVLPPAEEPTLVDWQREDWSEVAA